jgi:hypothetical protein
MMILEFCEIKNTASWWIPEIRRSGFFIYWLIIGLFFSAFISLFLIHIDISVRTGGIIRSLNEGSANKSMESDLIGECYVPSKDIGCLQKGQLVSLQIDAFDYNYFGIIKGNIYSIDDDFFLSDKTPFFKVRCLLNEKILKLPNGYAGELKNGMSFQARFIICNRSLWQLLYDGLADWLDPANQHTIKPY